MKVKVKYESYLLSLLAVAAKQARIKTQMLFVSMFSQSQPRN